MSFSGYKSRITVLAYSVIAVLGLKALHVLDTLGPDTARMSAGVICILSISYVLLDSSRASAENISYFFIYC